MSAVVRGAMGLLQLVGGNLCFGSDLGEISWLPAKGQIWVFAADSMAWSLRRPVGVALVEGDLSAAMGLLHRV